MTRTNNNNTISGSGRSEECIGGGSNGNNNNVPTGPCGACKYLRRKCINGCVFAPYFHLEQGAAHFAAVHKVFGASNASKMLLSVPPQKRLDAVVSMCYEALARVRDPVYGCVAQIFTLQQQILNLQAELAYTQARLATINLECQQQQPYPPDHDQVADFSSMQHEMQRSSWSTDMASNFVDQGEVDDGEEEEEEELESLARELVSKHLSASSSGSTFRPPRTSP